MAGRNAFWAWILLVSLAPLSTAGDAAEGRTYRAQAGETLEWPLPAGHFFALLVAGEDGALVDLENLSVSMPPGHTTFPPGNVKGTSAVLEEPGRRWIKVLEGDVQVIIARNDLQAGIPAGGGSTGEQANGTLAADECRAYSMRTTRITDPIVLHGQGEGIRFQAFASNLTPLGEKVGELEVMIDPNILSGALISACATGTGGAFRVGFTVGASSADQEPPRATTPAPAASLVLLALLAVAFARAR